VVVYLRIGLALEIATVPLLMRNSIIPTPREFSSDCGMALRFSWERADEVKKLLAAALVEWAALHAMNGDAEADPSERSV
jgi:hypothetical protein